MNYQLWSTCSDTTLHMAEACSACYLLSPQLGTHQVWERGVLARKRDLFLIHLMSLACASCEQEVSVSHLCFPSRALEQDEAVKAGCQHMGTASLLCNLHPRCYCFLQRALLSHITPLSQLIWCCLHSHLFSQWDGCFANTKDAKVKEKLSPSAILVSS